ncbi:AEC family transporter [Muricomes intestini]|uniref:AEC family transporter n=1 Tax=Muricomes intestini TaxID=1796634 RepID=UPI002FE2CF97
MFLLVAAGLILRKQGILKETANSVLTNLLIYLILPCNIIGSFFIEFNIEILKGFGVIIIVSTLIQATGLLFAHIFYNKETSEERKILQFGTICSNANFMGNPIAESVYGAAGLMYASVFLIPMRIVMWSAGISCFTKSQGKKEVIKKVLTHPCIFAVCVGMSRMLLKISLPVFLEETILSLGNCTTAISMVLIGTILAGAEPRSLFNKGILKYTFIRLILFPFLVFAGCRLFHIAPLISGICVLLTGMPAGSTTAIMAAKYDGNYVFATKCVVVSTLLSLVTIPLWCLAFIYLNTSTM